MLSTSFRNTLIASTLLVGASLLVGPAAFAAGDSGEVSGNVQEINTIGFEPDTLTPITPGQANAVFPMGDLTIRNNAVGGWDLEVQSLNGGKLVRGTESVTYTQLTVEPISGATITPVDLATAETDELLATGTYHADVAGEVTVAVTAEIAADAAYVQVGTYTDTLTFTLTSN